MTTKAADESKGESVTEAQSVESSASLEYTIKPSDEFFHVFELSHIFSTNESALTAKQIKMIQTKVDKLYNEVTNSENASLNDIITLAYSCQNICHGYIKKGKLRIAKIYILRCVNLVKGKELCAKSILIALKGHFHLGFIYVEQKKTEKAMQTFNKAIDLYLTYTHENEKYGNPIDFGDIITKSPIAKSDGYRLLIVIYKAILKLIIGATTYMDDHNLMVYNHLFLAAELKTLQEMENCFEWIEQVLKICNYLLNCDRFAEARNHIIAAVYVKNIFFHEKFYNMERQKFSSDGSKLSELDNKITIIWLKFAIRILRRSAERLLRLEKDEELEITNLKSGYPTKLQGDISQRLLLFNDIDTGIQFYYGSLFVPVKYISHYDDAYKLFINILRNISFVRFSLYSNWSPQIYSNILTGVYEACKYMALYEKDVANRSILQNGIVDLLSEAVENKTLLTHLYLQSGIRVYLAISYSTLIDVKLENLDAIHPLYMPEKYNTILLEIRCLVRNALIHLKMGW